MLFADFLQQVTLMFVMFFFGTSMLLRWAVRSGAASSVASAAGKGIAQKVLEGIFKKH